MSMGNKKIPDSRTMLTRSSGPSRKTGPRNITSHRRHEPITNQNRNEKGEEHVELLEYEWPDLPPLNSMEDAVCRSAVSRGVSYSPAVARSLNLINSRYRTDLRAMFQDHHARDYLQFKDSRVTLSTKLHFAPNRSADKLTLRLVRPVPVQLNADSENIRKAYVRSAPSGGNREGLGYGLHPRGPTNRLSLFLHKRNHQKTNDINRLNQAVDDIDTQDLALNASMQDKPGCTGSSHTSHGVGLTSTTRTSTDGSHRPDTTHKPRDETPHPHTCVSEPGVVMEKSKTWPQQLRVRSTLDMKSLVTMNYEELCAILYSKVKRSDIPQPMMSPYLAMDVNQRIWDWLKTEDQLDEFGHFMSVCG